MAKKTETARQYEVFRAQYGVRQSIKLTAAMLGRTRLEVATELGFRAEWAEDKK